MSSQTTVQNVNPSATVSPNISGTDQKELGKTNSAVPADNKNVSAGKLEAIAFCRKVEDLAREGNSLGSEALEEVSRMLGASCMNKFGRPSETAFVMFTLAMSQRNLSINARTQLANVANKAALAGGDSRKPVFKTTANASAMQGGFAYKLNLPATVEAAIG